MPDLAALWNGLIWPLTRMVLGLAAGLLLANILEALHWTQGLARFCHPIARAAHMGETASAAFALAFVSPAGANGLLAEQYRQKAMSFRELMLANLFNSLPAYMLHTPTIFLLTWPVLGWPAVVYVGLTLCAAVLRTGGTLVAGRYLLPERNTPSEPALHSEKKIAAANSETQHGTLRTATSPFAKAWKRFVRRLPKLVFFSVPVYLAMYALHVYGAFAALEAWLAAQTEWLVFLKPQAVGIVALHMAAELGAALGAAGSVLATGALDARDVVLALMVGNILSTPMRAVRHQLPAYAGFYAPRLGLVLVLANQGLRAASMALVTLCYYFWA